jgi:hypothetical protein
VREETISLQHLDVYFQQFLNMFRSSLCPSSGEQDLCYCMCCAALVLLVVVGSGCGALPCGVAAEEGEMDRPFNAKYFPGLNEQR